MQNINNHIGVLWPEVFEALCNFIYLLFLTHSKNNNKVSIFSAIGFPFVTRENIFFLLD